MPRVRSAGRTTRSQTRATFTRLSGVHTAARREITSQGVQSRSVVADLGLLDSLMIGNSDMNSESAHTTGRRIIGRRGSASTTVSASPPELTLRDVSSRSAHTSGRRIRGRRGSGSTPVVSASSPEPNVIDNTIIIATPPTRDVQVVDLDSWIPPLPTATTVTRSRRPLEVDLTCELDDEVFVVLEDIINPSQRSYPNSLPNEFSRSNSRPGSNAAASRRPIRSTAAESASNRLDYSDASETKEKAGLEASKSAFDGAASTSTHDGTASTSTRDVTTGIQCPICLDTLAQMKAANHQLHSTTCGHLFCHPCIIQVISNTKKCPTCRQSLTVKKIHPIFI